MFCKLKSILEQAKKDIMLSSYIIRHNDLQWYVPSIRRIQVSVAYNLTHSFFFEKGPSRYVWHHLMSIKQDIKRGKICPTHRFTKRLLRITLTSLERFNARRVTNNCTIAIHTPLLDFIVSERFITLVQMGTNAGPKKSSLVIECHCFCYLCWNSCNNSPINFYQYTR